MHYSAVGHIQDLVYKGVALGGSGITVEGTKKQAHGVINLDDMQGVAASGSWKFDAAHDELSTAWTLVKPYTRIPKCTVKKEGTRALITYKNGTLSGTFSLQGMFDKSFGLDKRALLEGTFQKEANELIVNALFNGEPVAMRAQIDPFEITSFSYKKAQEKGILLVNKQGKLEGTVEFAYIKDALKHFFDLHTEGQGKFSVRAHMQTTPLRFDISLMEGSIKIPQVQNMIQEANASLSLDIEKRSLTVKNAQVRLEKGLLTSPLATLLFSHKGSLAYAHLPVTAHDAYVGWDKNFTGMVSGVLTGVYSADKPEGRWLCSGSLSLDKGHMPRNVLSAQVKKDFMNSSTVPHEVAKNIDLDLHISTKTPLAVKTLFFTSNANLDAKIKGTLAKPIIKGSVELNKAGFFLPIDLSTPTGQDTIQTTH